MGIVGSGIMGSGIAEVAAKAGLQVVLRSRKQATADAMLASLEKSLAKQVDRGRIEQSEADAVRGRVSATEQLADLADCDLVIESVVEDLEVKRGLFTELDGIVKPDAILATNTSTLPVVEMAMATNRPDKVCGIHFFNPAPVQRLVELIPALTTSEGTLGRAQLFTEKVLGKHAIRAQDRSGFVVNALLIPYLLSAIRMFESGIASREDIDNGMEMGCAHPMGPLKLSDLIGLDTVASVAYSMYEEYKEPLYAAPPLLQRMVDAGRLGRKTGSGFYTYD